MFEVAVVYFVSFLLKKLRLERVLKIFDLKLHLNYSNEFSKYSERTFLNYHLQRTTTDAVEGCQGFVYLELSVMDFD